MSTPPRMNVYDLKPDQVKPLEDRMTGSWPDVWRELALSVYVTLISLPLWRKMSEAEMAEHITRGLGNDLGGTQPYIPNGQQKAAVERVAKVRQMLREGLDYKEVGRALGVTEARVRVIERESRRSRNKNSADSGN